jgi:hypothetical protein
MLPSCSVTCVARPSPFDLSDSRYLPWAGSLAQTNPGFSMTGASSWYWHAEGVVAGIEGSTPPPTRQLGFQGTYTIQSHIIPRRSCGSLPVYLSRTPTPMERFVENKSLSAIRPNGDRAVKSPFCRNFEPELGVWSLAVCGSRFSKIFMSLAP